jgi:hypothetical protein
MSSTPLTRIRRGFRWAAILGFVLLLPLAAHALWDYLEIRRLVREIDAIRAAGEPISEGQAGRGYRQLSPDEALAARHFIAAAVLAYPAVQGEFGALSGLHEHLAGHSSIDVASFAEQLRVKLESGAIALELADRAAALPFNGFLPGTSYNYRAQELTALLRLQSIRTAHSSLSGRGDEAVRSTIVSIASRPVLSDSLEGAAAPNYDVATVLSFSTPSTASLRRLLDQLRAHDRPDAFELAILGDRAAFIENILGGFYGGDAQTLQPYGPRSRGLVQAFWRPWFTRRFVETLRGWNELVAASRKPWPQKGTEMSAIYARFASPRRPQPPFVSEQFVAQPRWWLPPPSSSLFTLMVPRTFESLALDRASATAIAVALYRIERGGQLPATLQELRGGYIPELPVDPATGQPLRYRTDANSFMIYSVGADGMDDGGDLTSQLREVDVRGWGRRQLRGKDLGIRVLLHPLR